MTKLSARSRFRISLVAACLGTALGAGCGSSVTALSQDGGPGANGAAGAHGSAGTNGTGGTTGAGGSIFKIPIGSTQCSDGKDNDGDGLIDGADPECTGAADNDEGSFATGIPGDNMDACKQDCFFDGNSGMGDDGCQWELQCDPKNTNTRCPYDPAYVSKHAAACSTSASQSQKCIDNCRKYVPNGCDCFGCCAVPGAPTPIRLDPTCTAKDFGDPTKCSPCTQVTQCMNPCERCELCVGKNTVPADCGYTPPAPDGGTYDAPPAPDSGYGTPQCNGYVSCVPGMTVCPSGTSCFTGCCLADIP